MRVGNSWNSRSLIYPSVNVEPNQVVLAVTVWECLGDTNGLINLHGFRKKSKFPPPTRHKLVFSTEATTNARWAAEGEGRGWGRGRGLSGPSAAADSFPDLRQPPAPPPQWPLGDGPAGLASQQGLGALVNGGKSREVPGTPGDRYSPAPTGGPGTLSASHRPAAISGPARPGPAELGERRGLFAAAAASPAAAPGQAAPLRARVCRGAGGPAGGQRSGTRVPPTLVYYQPSAARGMLGAVVSSRPSQRAAAAAKTTAPRVPLG